jgi:hypothetical protein
MTAGHHFLLKEFGIAPKVGWQIGTRPLLSREINSLQILSAILLEMHSFLR